MLNNKSDMNVENSKNIDNVKAQMRKGILEYCILAILSREDSYAPRKARQTRFLRRASYPN